MPSVITRMFGIVRIAAPLVVVFLPMVGNAQIQNPIGCATITDCVYNVVRAALGLVAVLALAGIVYGGFLYITAAGNQDRIEEGKRAVFYSIIGIVVAGLAFAIVTFIFQALSGGGPGGAPGFGGQPGPGGPGFGGAPGGGAPGFGGRPPRAAPGFGIE